jgi:hypothetical protein
MFGVHVNRCTAYNNCASGIKINCQAYPGTAYTPVVENCYLYSDGNSPPNTNHQWWGLYIGHDAAIIKNNLIGPSHKNSGIYCDSGADGCTIVYNTFVNSISHYSIQLDGTTTTGSVGNTIKNNIFCNDATVSGANYLIYASAGTIANVAATNTFDYNVYYYNGNAAAVFAQTTTTFSQWQALTGSPDANSTLLSAVPDFVTRYTDMHAAAAGNLLATGTPISVVVDKDGGPRDGTNPTAGCYEDAS